MSQVVTRLFDTSADAESAVRELEAVGVRHQDIAFVCNDEFSRRQATQVDDEGDVPGHASRAAAEVGGEVGGVAGLLAGIGVLAIPGIGPVMAAGWVVSASTRPTPTSSPKGYAGAGPWSASRSPTIWSRGSRPSSTGSPASTPPRAVRNTAPPAGPASSTPQRHRAATAPRESPNHLSQFRPAPWLPCRRPARTVSAK
jgi:hypothetical protein